MGICKYKQSLANSRDSDESYKPRMTTHRRGQYEKDTENKGQDRQNFAIDLFVHTLHHVSGFLGIKNSESADCDPGQADCVKKLLHATPPSPEYVMNQKLTMT